MVTSSQTRPLYRGWKNDGSYPGLLRSKLSEAFNAMPLVYVKDIRRSILISMSGIQRVNCGTTAARLTVRWNCLSSEGMLFPMATLFLTSAANVTVVNAAIGPRDQDVIVTNSSDTIVKPDKIDDRYWPEDCRRKSVSDGIAVEMHSLDSYARQHNIFPTLLKVDVEGYEIEVLRGSRSLLSLKPKLCLEIHHPDALARYQTSVGDLFGLIEMSEHKLWLQVGDNDDIHPIEDTAQLPKLGRRFHLYALPLSRGSTLRGDKHIGKKRLAR